MKQKDNEDRDQHYAAWVDSIGETKSTSGHCNGPTRESASEGAWSKRQKHWMSGLVS